MEDKLYSGFLVLTYGCNNRCKFCYASPTKFKNDLMEVCKIKDYLKLMRSLGIKTLGLLGGEPTLHPKIFEIIKLAKKQGFKVTIYTNGRKLSNRDFVKKLKKAGIDFVNFSIQTGKKHSEEHDKTVQVPGAWKQSKKGIENCKKEGIKINIQTVLTHTNLKIYKELIKEFSYANLFIYYRQIPPIFLGEGFFNQKVLSNKDTKEIYKKIYLYANKKKKRTYLFSRMPLCWWDENDKIEKNMHENIVSHCHIINGSILVIDVDGKILPCAQFVNMPLMDLIEGGKIISKQKFFKLFKKGNAKRIRQKLSYVPNKKCLKCKYFGKRCTGGCPLVDFELGPNAPFD